ncbi:MAG: methyltransferase domain-containing protein [Leptospirales bacterium]|nr:methyltransferase domain-containing protein [Leptospirales bacterium]
MKKNDWNDHYNEKKSILSYPDENLVRLISNKINRPESIKDLAAIDIGCGSGRHIALLKESGIEIVYGSDYSLNALKLCQSLNLKNIINCENRRMPFKDNTFDITVAWGSLHYSSKDETHVMLNEIRRIMKKDGELFATLRRDNDTYLKTGIDLGNNTWKTGLDDISGTVVSFFNESEINRLFNPFGSFSYGWIERSIIGDTGKIISHWIVSAKK